MSSAAVFREVLYSVLAGYRPLALDLYVPPAPAGTCLYLHGGGWRVGSRRSGPGAAADWFFGRLTDAGLAVASVDYRLSSEARFPAQSTDVSAAAAFLVEHADEYALNGPLVIWGVSAGGQLAALHALRSDSVRAAVCWYPVTDLEVLSADAAAAGGQADRGPTSREGMLVGGHLDDHPDQVRAASPVHSVGANPPPFLLVHGTADYTVPLVQSRRFGDALAEAGGRVVVDEIEGATHIFPELGEAETAAVIDRSIAFLLDAIG